MVRVTASRLVAAGLAALSACTVTPALAVEKLAFVTGTAEYDFLGDDKKLPRAVADSSAMARTLTEVGFTVTAQDNMTRSAFNSEWAKFVDSVNSGDTVTIFYSGHGIQIDGLNYLLPRDVPKMSPSRQQQMTRESLSVAEMLQDLKKRKPRVTVLILDACRDNPFLPGGTKSAGAPGGLAGMAPPSGTFIMYAAGDGETALERLPPPPGQTNQTSTDPDPNSLYTRKLLPMMKTKGLDLRSLAVKIRDEVREVALDVGHNQRPTYYDNLDGQFCFTTCEGNASVRVASLLGGRDELRQNNLSNARWHFEQLALNKDVEAMRELAALDEQSRNWDGMLGWLVKGAEAGDVRAKMDLAWIMTEPDRLQEMPAAWVPRLTDDGARAEARQLIAAGNLEAVLILQKVANRNRPDGKPLIIAPEFQAAIDKGYGPAMAKLAREIRDALPDGDDDKLKDTRVWPAYKAETVRALALFETAARRGDAPALYELLGKRIATDDDDQGNDKLHQLAKKFDVKGTLTGSETVLLLNRALEQPRPGSGLAQDLRESEAATVSDEEYARLAGHLIDRLTRGRDVAKDLPRAVTLSDAEFVYWNKRYKDCSNKNSCRVASRLQTSARNLTVAALRESGRHADAFRVLAPLVTGSDDELLYQLAAIVDAAGWPADLEKQFVERFKDACKELEFGEFREDKAQDCEGMAVTLTAAKRRATFRHIHDLAREYLTPKDKDKTPPSDGLQKGRAVGMLAALAEIEPSYLRPGETVAGLNTEAAALEFRPAYAWLKANAIAVPESRVVHPTKTEDVKTVGRWKLDVIKQNGVRQQCRSYTAEAGIVTAAANGARGPRLWVIGGGRGGGFGVPTYVADAEGIDPLTVRMFINRDEVRQPVQVSGKQILIQGDTAAFIRRLAQATMIRFEFRAGTRDHTDVHSLVGFTDIYKAMLGQCTGMESALVVAAAAPVAQPGVLPPAAAAKSAAATPAPKAGTGQSVMERQADRYFRGDGYRGIPGGTYSQCAAACLAEARCLAIEFQNVSRLCQLYAAVEQPLSTAGTDVAIKR